MSYLLDLTAFKKIILSRWLVFRRNNRIWGMHDVEVWPIRNGNMGRD